MAQWFRKVFVADESAQADIIMDACDDYEAAYEEIKKAVHDRSSRIEQIALRIPGLAEQAYGGLQDLESILEFVETNENREKLRHTKRYLEHYDRTLSDRMAEKYADGEDTVYALRMLRHRVGNVRNQYLGLTKGLEYLHFQIGNVVKLKAAGLDDATVR